MYAHEIIETLGTETATELSRKLGGRFEYISAFPTPGHPIAQAIGYEGLVRLWEKFGAGPVYIPTGIWRSWRDKKIRGLKMRGLKADQIAELVGLAPRTVRHILQSGQ